MPLSYDELDHAQPARPDGAVNDRLHRIEKALVVLLENTNHLESVLRPVLSQEDSVPHRDDSVPQLAARAGSSPVFIRLHETEERITGIAGRLHGMAQGVEL